MYIVLTGGAGHITKPLALKLLDAGHAVIVISRHADNLKELVEAGAIAETGSIEDAYFLTKAFTRADAVYTMVPPKMATENWQGWIAKIGENYAAALKAAQVKHVVNLSSIGAHMAEGAGPVSGLHHVENSLNQLDKDVSVVHLRPGYFYYNQLNNMGMIKHMNMVGGNYGDGNTVVPMAASEDIAAAAAAELSDFHDNPVRKIRYVVSDEVTTAQIASVLGGAIGKPGLPWVNFTDEQAEQGAVQAGLPPEMAASYREMGQAIRNGKFFEHYKENKPAEFGKVKLADFAEEFKAAYEAQ